MAARQRSTILDGRTLRYVDRAAAANAPTIVLVHGFPLGIGMWAPQMDAFEGWRLIVPSLPGFDGSSLLPEATTDGFARDVLAVLDAAGVERAVFCGLSMGGHVSWGVVRQAPQRIAGLVLADTRSGADSDEAKAGRVRMMELLDREGLSAIASDVMPKYVGATTLATRPAVVAEVRRLIESHPHETVKAAARALMNRPDSTPLLAGITAPVLIVVGEEDTLTPPVESEKMHAAIAGSRLVKIPGAGHITNMETPEAFNQAVTGFLGSLR